MYLGNTNYICVCNCTTIKLHVCSHGNCLRFFRYYSSQMIYVARVMYFKVADKVDALGEGKGIKQV